MRCLAAGVVLLLAAVTGCSAGEAAPAEVGPVASGSVTTPGSSVAPSLAPEAKETVTAAPTITAIKQFPVTVDGASAFAREYVRLIGEGFATADSAAVRKHSATGCEGCEALIGAMDQAASDGLRRRGGEYTVTSVATPPLKEGDVVLLLTYTRAPSDIIDAMGNVVDQAPAVAETTVQMRLVHTDRWRTQGYRVV